MERERYADTSRRTFLTGVAEVAAVGTLYAVGSEGAVADVTKGGTTTVGGSQSGRVPDTQADDSDWTQQAKLVADDGDVADSFGAFVTISDDGSTALVGAPDDEDPNGGRAGSAYVFENSGGSWHQQAKLVPDDGDSGDTFGESVALSADGSTGIVGARGTYSDPREEAGSAYVFERTGEGWTQQAKLAASGGDTEEIFGESVALSADGSTALVGAQEDEAPNGERAGSAYVFTNSGGSWRQEAKLLASDGDSRDTFGWSVALSGDGSTALVGAQGDEDPNGGGAGSAYVFTDSDGSWRQQAKLVASDGDGRDKFGFSVALSRDGSIALVQAQDLTLNGIGWGYVFERTGTAWSQQAKLTADPEEWFGLAGLSGDGSTACVGYFRDDTPNGKDSGSAYVFTNSGGSWRQETKLVPDDGDTGDKFGGSVALSGDGSTALVGASWDEDPNGTEAGSAYVFSRPSQSQVTASFSTSPDSPIVYEPITFDARASTPMDDIDAYRWSFPDTDATVRGAVVEHAFEAPGEYSVTLRIEAGDETATETETVTVESLAVGSIAGEVVGSEGTPVAGATVKIIEPIHEYLALELLQGNPSDPLPTLAETTTDASGTFEIDDVPVGEYHLLVEPTDTFGGALREDVVVRSGTTTEMIVEVQADRYLAELDADLLGFRNTAMATVDSSTEATADTYLSGYQTFEQPGADGKEVLLRILQSVNFALGITDADSAVAVKRELVSFIGDAGVVPLADHGFDHAMADLWQTVHETEFQSALKSHTDACLSMNRITDFEPTGSLSEARNAFEATEKYDESTSGVDSAWERYDQQIATTEPPDEFDLAGVKDVIRTQTDWLEGTPGTLTAGVSITPYGDIYLTDAAEYHADIYNGIEQGYETARSLELVTEGLQAAGKGVAVTGVVTGGTTTAAASVAYAGGAVGSFALSMYQVHAKNRLAHMWTNTITYWVSDLEATAAVSGNLVDWLEDELDDPTDLRAIDGSIDSVDLGLVEAYDRTVLIANRPEYPPWWTLFNPKWKAVGTAAVTIRNTGDIAASARVVALDTYETSEGDLTAGVSDGASFEPQRGDQPFSLTPGEERSVAFEFNADFDPFTPFIWHRMEIGLWMDGRVPARHTQFYYVLPDLGRIPVPQSTAPGGLGSALDRSLSTDRFVITHGGKRPDEGLTVQEWAQRVGPITRIVDSEVTPEQPQVVTGYTPSEQAAGVTFVLGATAGSDAELHVYDDQGRRVGPEPGADEVVEIPEASYSGSAGATQIVEIAEPSADRYRVRVDTTRSTAGAEVPVTVHAVERPEREATLVVSPTAARQILSPSDTEAIRIEVGEGGNQASIADVDVSLGALTTAEGNTIPEDALDVSPSGFDLSPGERRTIRVTVDATATPVPETGETRFEGTATVDTENAGTVTVELSVLVLDAGATSVALSSAEASVRGIHVQATDAGELESLPEGVTPEATYDLRSEGMGEFTLTLPEGQFGESPSAYVSAVDGWTTVEAEQYPNDIRISLSAGSDQTLIVGQDESVEQTGNEEDQSGDTTTVSKEQADVGGPDEGGSRDTLPDWVPLAGAAGVGAGASAGLYRYLQKRTDSEDQNEQ